MTKTYSASFWILCIHMLLFFVSFNLLVPELNAYISSLGGADEKWKIMTFWTISAGISRPFSGKIADNFGRKNVIIIGVVISIIISFLYPLFTGVTAFLTLRFLHGFSTGFQPTGATALVGDLIPQGKRGAAMGIFSMTISIGFGLGSWLSTTIFQHFAINGLFIASGLLGMVALSLTFFIEEKKPPKIKYSFKNIFPKINEVFAPEVIQPSIIMLITAIQAGIYYLIVPEYSTYLGIKEKGIFWLYFTITSLGSRFFAGRAVDKYGYRTNIAIGLVIEIMSGYICMTAETPLMFFIGAGLFGLGGGMITPAVFAWTTDLANPKFKGRGLGTMFIALEFGIAIGSYVAQQIYGNLNANLKYTFMSGIVLCGIGLIYLYIGKKIEQKKPLTSS